MQQGYIKLYRKIVNWEWFDNSYMVHLYLYLIIYANTQDRRWHGDIIKRGQLLTSVSRLHDETNIPISTIRRCLKRLEKTGEIIVKATNRFSTITICNYDSYQANEQTDEQTDELSSEQINNKQETNNRLSDEQHLKNNKNNKNDKNNKKETTNVVSKKEKALEERKKDFANKLEPYLEKYGRDMLNDFYAYWTEHNDNGKKMKYEMEKTFSIAIRLARWKKNDEESKYPKYSNQGSSPNKLVYGEHIVEREDGTKYRTYGNSGAVIPLDAPHRPSWDSQWDAANGLWFRE